MWRNETAPTPSTSSASTRKEDKKHSSTFTLQRASSSSSLFKRAISLQFLVKNSENLIDSEKKAFIKMRYKDTAKHVIWPTCRLPDNLKSSLKPVPLASPTTQDPRTVLHEPDIEDHRSPYLPCTINHVLRSDSEDSSSAEQILEMTRCSSTDSVCSN